MKRKYTEEIVEFAEKIALKLQKKYGIENLDVAIVLGSGQISAVPRLENEITVKYSEIGMPKSKVPGHSGSFVFGKYKGKNIVFVSRIHFYEYGDIDLVKLPFEVVAKLGVKTAYLLTSTGGVNKNLKVGDIMLIRDHINLSGKNPMVGMENIKFVGMQDCYNSNLSEKIKEMAKKEKIDLKEGVICQMSGPNYETKAEIEMLRNIGVDVVSMSTVHDCIICNYLGIKVAAMAIVVNVYGLKNGDVTHKEVVEYAEKSCHKIKKILESVI